MSVEKARQNLFGEPFHFHLNLLQKCESLLDGSGGLRAAERA